MINQSIQLIWDYQSCNDPMDCFVGWAKVLFLVCVTEHFWDEESDQAAYTFFNAKKTLNCMKVQKKQSQTQVNIEIVRDSRGFSNRLS